MNTGIGDAVNLAWKLAAVLRRLRSRQPARHLRARAHRLCPPAGRHDRSRVYLCDGQRARSPGGFARGFVPLVAPLVFRLPARAPLPVPHRVADRRQLSRHARCPRASRARSEAAIASPGSELRPAEDNFALLTTLAWQVHVYGEPPSGVWPKPARSCGFRCTCFRGSRRCINPAWCGERCI